MSGMVVVSNEQYADELAQARFDLEPGIHTIVRLVSPNNEDLPDEPLKLLEVNENTLEIGFRPIQFPARVKGAAWYPPVVIVEVTPEEYATAQSNPMLLPNGWQMTKVYRRSA